jgi:valyl-tRNA synthetase
MAAEIPKVYAPESIEPQWAQLWVERRLYRPADDNGGPRFALVIPPPNITGSLHMGHMLEHTEIDILMRWRRMKGNAVLWLPGTDHASIAAQMIVEREIGREALPDLPEGAEAMRQWQREGQRLRLAMGREKFVERCWQWKETSGGAIRRQMVRLGASCDWTRERFTMDPAYTRAVLEVFIRLYREGLIYRDEYIVNWCPRCGTAVSDLEVGHEERQGSLWFIRYPLADGSGFITVATTRPETMLGDTAVAVNPQDERYQTLVGKFVTLPLTDRTIPIVADSFVDAEFGTGAVKVTPAHDPNDFALGLRHKLPSLGVIGSDAKMTAAAGKYAGLDRYRARDAVESDLRALGLLEKVQEHGLNVGVCQRCKTVVEPLLSLQWFMKMKPLAEPAIRVVEEGRIRIQPESGRKKYLNWMYNIHDWCISRQLWWGHRIPVWYCDACGQVMVSADQPVRCNQCGGQRLRAETDVLDTWFSSALWPFVTLGWPENSADLARFYPTDLMIMGEDILFFWGARMIMMGLKFMNDVPFRDLYIHALVRDAERQKMSKTKGNVLDPLEITEKYGTDAVRFALAISAAPGTDIAFSQDKVDAYRAFANKIWNAGRFLLMNLQNLPERMKAQLGVAITPAPKLGYGPVIIPQQQAVEQVSGSAGTLALVDRWIFSRLATITAEIDKALAEFRFHEAAYSVYHFFWHEFCDWYLEWVKPQITRAPEGDRVPAAWLNIGRIFEASLRLLHPFMPFITEELWHQLPGHSSGESLSLAGFALADSRALDPVSEKQFDTLRELITGIRNGKSEAGQQSKRPSVQVASDDLRVLELFRQHQEAIARLAGLEGVHFTRGRLAGDIPGVRVAAEFDFRLFFEETIDPQAERARLEKEMEKLGKALKQIESQLGNPAFASRAPQEVVRGAEKRHRELKEHYRKVAESLERLA